MAAQAVDFTISGQLNRALFVTDSDEYTRAMVADNGESSSRIRATGSSEMMDGSTVGIQVEYQAVGSALGLRHANVQYGGEFGRITIGQGSEAGDGSQYSDTTEVFGIGHGAGTPAYFLLGDYFGSLDGGSRENMIRYDTPAIGPVSAAVSVANNDRVSGQISLSTEFGGTSFGAKVATLQEKGEPSTMGASFGATMASGLTVSGAWAKGDDHLSEVSPGLLFICEAISEEDCDAHTTKAAMAIQDALDKLEDGEEEYRIDPNYFQAEIGYRFGNTGVAVSWYQSEDFVIEGSKGTAIGIGARHTFPKAGAEIYTAVQNYDAEMYKDAKSVDQTVFVVGTRVTF